MSRQRREYKLYNEDTTIAFKQQQTEIEQLTDRITFTAETVSNHGSQISQLQVADDGIRTEVAQKVGASTIISSINQSPESVTINASKVNLNSYVTMTNLATDGQTTISGGNITTGIIQDSGGNTTFNLSTGALNIGSGSITLGSTTGNYYFKAASNGALTAYNATIRGTLTAESGYYKTVVSNGAIDFYYNGTAAGSIRSESPTAINGPGPFITISKDSAGGGFMIDSPPGSNARLVAFYYKRSTDNWQLSGDFALTGSMKTSLTFESGNSGINPDNIGIALFNNNAGVNTYVRVNRSGSVDIVAPYGLYVNGVKIAN